MKFFPTRAELLRATSSWADAHYVTPYVIEARWADDTDITLKFDEEHHLLTIENRDDCAALSFYLNAKDTAAMVKALAPSNTPDDV